MSRKKKSKTSGFSDVIVVRQRSEADKLGRELKKSKKHKGLKTGNRNSSTNAKDQKSTHTVKDPRIGSKKPIPLIVEQSHQPTKQARRMSAEKELEMLENDTQLNVLLDRLENGEKLGAGLQAYVDEKLDRIEVLMKQLGLFEDTDDEDVSLVATKPKKKTQSLTDDELLSSFEDFDPDSYQ